MKKLLIFCSSWMFDKPASEGWKVFCNIQEKDPRYSLSNKFGPSYIRAIHDVKPDFVLAINVGCSERRFDTMDKPRQYDTKYVTWSTDSYRHTQRCTTSDLHLTSIPDATMTKNDNYLPLFFDRKIAFRPLSSRKIRIGIHCRRYDNENCYRQRHISQIQRVLAGALFVNQKELPPEKYLSEIAGYTYGLNIATYHDGLPNFRSFEYGALGVMPVCSALNRDRLTKLFSDNIILYDDPSEIPSLLKPYDPAKLQRYYAQKHSLRARLHELFKNYFDLEF